MTGPEPAGGSAAGGGTSCWPAHTDNVPLDVNVDGAPAAGAVGAIGAGATGACAKTGPAHRAVASNKL
jgi:hypothetical protein